jgi:FAD/FMN-containing dehydrogenase
MHKGFSEAILIGFGELAYLDREGTKMDAKLEKAERKAIRVGGYGGSKTREALKNQKKVVIPDEQKKRLLEDLRKALSPERVKDEDHITTYYRGPMHGVPRREMSKTPPDMVVYIESREELQEIFKIATKYKVPVTPVGRQSTMLGGIPFNGGIVVDFMGMNKIHQIDYDHNYVVVEPGTTFQEVMNIIRPKGFVLGKGDYPSSFPIISPMVAWFTQHNMSNRMLDQVIGLEVCTPDGSIIYTGTMAYGETDYWSDASSSLTRLTNLFSPHQATIGVVTKAAIRIWPLLDRTAFPTIGFNDFASAFRWSHAMSKSGLVADSMVWTWVMVGAMEFGKTARHLDYMEARMKYTQEQVPEDIGLFNCYVYALMHGYEEEIEGALKTAQRLAKEYGGTYLSEEWMEENLPRTWRHWTNLTKDFHYEKQEEAFGGVGEGPGFSVQFMGPREEIIRMYEGLGKKLKSLGWKNYKGYSKMMNAGQVPWIRFMPTSDSLTKEELAETVRISGEMTNFILENYGLHIQQNLLYFNDPENPEEVVDRVKPIRRLLRAVQKEFDPENILSPAMKKYTLT